MMSAETSERLKALCLEPPKRLPHKEASFNVGSTYMVLVIVITMI